MLKLSIAEDIKYGIPSIRYVQKYDRVTLNNIRPKNKNKQIFEIISKQRSTTCSLALIKTFGIIKIKMDAASKSARKITVLFFNIFRTSSSDTVN
jgi:hypothetical protein